MLPRLVGAVTYKLPVRHLSKLQKLSPSATQVLTEYPILQNRKILPHTYIVDSELAEAVADKLDINSDDGTQWIEVNPGPGLLTTALLNRGVQKLTGIEARKEFVPRLETLKQTHGSRFAYMRKDFFKGDFIVHGRFQLAKSLNVKETSWKEDPVLNVVLTNGMWGREARMLISCLYAVLYKLDSIYGLGRVQFYWFMTYREYLYWTVEHPYPNRKLHHWKVVLQNLFFESETLLQVPVNCFQPQPKVKQAKISYLKSENQNMMYLVRFVPKWNLYSDILEERYLPVFQFFVKDLLAQTGLRLLPKMDLWFPKLGFDLIKSGFTVSQTVNDCSPQDLLRLFKVMVEQPGFEHSLLMAAYFRDKQENVDHWNLCTGSKS